MFWNDPTLYSTTVPYTVPYKEFGTVPFPGVNPFIPKFGPPTFAPPTFGTLPYDLRLDPRMFAQPWMQTPTFTPWTAPYIPFPAYNVPFMQPYNVNLPHQVPFRPFFY